MTNKITNEDMRYIEFIEELTTHKFSHNKELIENIKIFLQYLPEDYREVVVLKHGLDGNKIHSIAEISDRCKNESNNIYGSYRRGGESKSAIRNKYEKIRRILYGRMHSYKICLTAYNVIINCDALMASGWGEDND